MSKLIETLSADFVTRFARDLYHCSSCNYCVDAVWPERGMHSVCATMEQHTRAPGYSGRGYIEAARAIMEGQALDATALAERVFTCTTCGNCETVCPIGLRPASVGRALREELLAADCLPQALAAARDSFVAHGNPYGLPRERRHAWAASLEQQPQDASITLFAGCAAALPTGEEAQASYALLMSAGISLRVASDTCCGAPLSELGLRREGEALARAAAARLDVGEVLVAGCECRQQLQNVGLASRSIAGWLCAAHAEGRLALRWKDAVARPAAVRLIESCQLKRATPDIDEAAVTALFKVLGVALLNPQFPNLHASCCGAGGGMPTMAPASAARMARARLPQVGMAVSLDARCASHMRACAAEGVEVLGFASFVARYFDVAARSPS